MEATISAIISVPFLTNFNPRLQEGGDNWTFYRSRPKQDFNPRLPRRRRPLYVALLPCLCCISIHASKKEATNKAHNEHYVILFQSTPPRRRRQQHIVIPQLSCTYLVSTTFLSTIFSFISQYIVLFFLF